MTRIRASKLCDRRAAFALVAVAGCAATPKPIHRLEQPTDAAIVRRPDAVLIEPQPALPEPVVRAPARGVIVLREPIPTRAVVQLVQSVVDAWQRGSLDALVALLTADAGPIESRGRGRAALVESWRQRLHAHEYTHLAGVELVRPERIARWDPDQLDSSGADRVPELHVGEVYVRAPLEVTRADGEKLFGEVMELVVRTEDGKLKVAAYGESDLP